MVLQSARPTIVEPGVVKSRQLAPYVVLRFLVECCTPYFGKLTLEGCSKHIEFARYDRHRGESSAARTHGSPKICCCGVPNAMLFSWSLQKQVCTLHATNTCAKEPFSLQGMGVTSVVSTHDPNTTIARVSDRLLKATEVPPTISHHLSPNHRYSGGPL